MQFVSSSDSPSSFSSTIRLQFPSSKAALVVKQCLEVDEELQPDKITKEFETFDSILEM